MGKRGPKAKGNKITYKDYQLVTFMRSDMETKVMKLLFNTPVNQRTALLEKWYKTWKVVHYGELAKEQATNDY